MIPAAGTQVTALPFGARETLTPEQLLDLDPYQGPTTPVTGPLQIEKVPADYDFNAPAYTLYLVDNIPVDPLTIKIVEVLRASTAQQTFANSCHDPDTGQFCETQGGEILSEELRKSIKTTMNRLESTWGVKAEVKVDPTIPDEDSAFVSLDDPQVIRLHPDFTEKIKGYVGHPDYVAKTVEDIIVHEYGHVLSFVLDRQNRPLAEKLLDYFDIKARRRIHAKEISVYGSVNLTEAIAEAFLQHDKGISTPWSRSAAKIFRKEFGDAAG